MIALEKKKFKNYFLLIGLVILTFVISLYLFSWLKQYKEVKLGNPIITEVLPEVKYNNLNSFLKERNFLVLYMCTPTEKKCRSFENKFKNFVVEYNLTDDIVYLNLDNNEEKNNVLDKIYKKYKHEDLIKKLNEYPTLLIFSEGKIIDLLNPSRDGKLTITSVKDFVEGYDLLND